MFMDSGGGNLSCLCAYLITFLLVCLFSLLCLYVVCAMLKSRVWSCFWVHWWLLEGREVFAISLCSLCDAWRRGFALAFRWQSVTDCNFGCVQMGNQKNQRIRPRRGSLGLKRRELHG